MSATPEFTPADRAIAVDLAFTTSRGRPDISAIARKVAALRQSETERLTSAIRWALGESADGFEPTSDEPLRPDGHPMARYWWRSELRKRAGL